MTWRQLPIYQCFFLNFYMKLDHRNKFCDWLKKNEKERNISEKNAWTLFSSRSKGTFVRYLDSCFHRTQFNAKWGYFKVLQGVAHARRKRRFSLHARTLVYIYVMLTNLYKLTKFALWIVVSSDIIPPCQFFFLNNTTRNTAVSPQRTYT